MSKLKWLIKLNLFFNPIFAIFYWPYLCLKIWLKFFMLMWDVLKAYVIMPIWGEGRHTAGLIGGSFSQAVDDFENKDRKLIFVILASIVFTNFWLSFPEFSTVSSSGVLTLVGFILPITLIVFFYELARQVSSKGISSGNEYSTSFGSDGSAFIKKGSRVTQDAMGRAGDAAKDLAKEGKMEGAIASKKDAGKVGHRMILDLPIIGDLRKRKAAELAGKSASELSEAEAAEALAGAGASLGLPIILGIIAVAIVTVITFAIFFLIFSLIAGTFLASVLGPVAGSAGTTVAQQGGAYAAWAQDSVGDRYVSGIPLDDEMQAVGEAKQRVYCLFKGPACLRQWQFNNTQRPDSSDVGEEFGLEINDFRLGSGDSIDVAYKDKSYAIPISFQVSNTRHGLDGITAKNVQYRVKIVDSKFGPNNPYCDTGWQHVDAFDADKSENDEVDGDDVYPGTSAATGFLRIDNLTLEDCNMRQPALGDYRSARLYVRYDYFSQATLYFDAMSREYQVNQDISVAPKDSVTADTPVKAAINVMDPAIFETELGGINSQQFPVRVTLNSEDRSVDYQVKDFKIRKSSAACVADGDGNCANQKDDYMECSFKPINYRGDSSNFFEPDETAKKQMIVSAEGGIENDYWFTKSRPAPIIGCQMQLDESQNFNPSGETLTMGVAANYTVRLENSIGSLKLINSRCTTINCPILEPISLSKLSEEPYRTDIIEGHKFDGSEESMKEYWDIERSICNGVDAGNGCAVTEKLDGNSDVEDYGVGRGDMVVKANVISKCPEEGKEASSSMKIVGMSMDDVQSYLKNPSKYNITAEEHQAELETCQK